MEEHIRHKRAFSFFRRLLSGFICKKLNYQYDDLGSIEGPYLLLANHNIEMDPIIVGIAARNQLYFVASEHIMRKGLGTWFLMRYFKPIIHMKGKAGLKSSMEILRTIRQGHSVALFPEGNRSFNGRTMDIPDVTGKLARSCKAKVVTFRTEGGYLTQPRWSTTLRRGRIYGHLVNVYEAETLRHMSEEEINEAIRKDLYEDACASQKENRIAFKGKHLALGMESTLYMCPKCQKYGALTTDDEKIMCQCGYQAKYNEFGELEENDGTIRTIAQWDDQQREHLQGLIATGADITFEDEVTANCIENHEVIRSRCGRLKIRRDDVEFDGEKIPVEDIQGVAVFSRNVLSIHLQNDQQHYELRGPQSFNALKYLYLYQFLRTREEI